MYNYYTNLFTKPCVKQSIFLWILQMGKGNYSSVIQQISFIIQVSSETPRSGTGALATRIQGSSELRKCLVWHERRKMHSCSAVNRDLDNLGLNEYVWFSHSRFTRSTIVAATAQKSQFGLGHSLLLSSSCEVGAKETVLAATERRRFSLPSQNQCNCSKSPC